MQLTPLDKSQQYQQPRFFHNNMIKDPFDFLQL